MSIPTNGSFQENHETDSDTMSDGPADYQPISASDDEFDEGNALSESLVSANGGDLHFELYPDGQSFDSSPCRIPNFYNAADGIGRAENGISNLGLHGCGEGNEREEEEEEEEKRREEWELAISRAFREDESRRSAPLTPEDASRVMDAMRGVVFRGGTPDWVGRIPEDQWLAQLSRLRRPTSS